jgi:hypothetical protein
MVGKLRASERVYQFGARIGLARVNRVFDLERVFQVMDKFFRLEGLKDVTIGTLA